MTDETRRGGNRLDQPNTWPTTESLDTSRRGSVSWDQEINADVDFRLAYPSPTSTATVSTAVLATWLPIRRTRL